MIKYTPMTSRSSYKNWLCNKANFHFVTKPIINLKNIFLTSKNKKIIFQFLDSFRYFNKFPEINEKYYR